MKATKEHVMFVLILMHWSDSKLLVRAINAGEHRFSLLAKST